MHKLILCIVLAGLSLPVYAAKAVTVAQLEEMLGASKYKPDAEVANQLSDLELSERLSAARFLTLKAGLPDEKAQQALVALADQSQFLDPPASEIPSTATPDFAAQRRIMSLVVAYVSKSIPRLPNFFANRVTTSYEDTPHVVGNDFTIPYQPLHQVGNNSATVLYRDGREVVVTGTAKDERPNGLNTWGVFGPVLGTVLEDAARSKLAWSHWEQGATGPLAVFSYAVPKERSHYLVDFCCVAELAATRDANLRPFSQIVAYHGEIAADPKSGAILRLLLDADMKASDPVAQASIVVEYGPVVIGGNTYICPVKSISRTLAQTLQFDPRYQFPLADTLQPLKMALNDVVFDQFHVFRAEARLVADNYAGGASAPAAAPLTKAAPNTPELAGAISAAPVNSAPIPSATALPAASSTEAPAASSALAANAEIREEEADSPLDASANPGQPMASGYTLQAVSRLVDVRVVVADKKGHLLRDLKQEDFEVYDNGRKQTVRFFSKAAEELPASATAPSGTEASSSASVQPIFSNRGSEDAKRDGGKTESNTTILLIDSSNLSFNDLIYARTETMRFLRALPPSERVGLYVLRSHDFQVLAEETADHTLLEQKLSRWMPSAGELARAQDEEQRNRQQFETVHSMEDLLYVNGNTSNDPEGHTQTLDPALRDWGSNPGRDAMMIMVGMARHLAAISGHKNLVWISSDNALVDWSDKADSIEKGDKNIELNILHAQEAMNEAHVSVYPLDVSQLEGGMTDASISRKNVELAEVTPMRTQAGSLGPEASSGKDIDTADNGGHTLGSTRLAAQMQQDMRPIQGPVRHLAEATGGQIFRRSGGISDELLGVVEDGHAAYQLSFSPDVPADGQFHTITVKLAAVRKGVAVRYRTGYLYSKEPATLKERFQQAVWLPVDANQLAVTAQPTAFQGSLHVKIDINVGDLALEQKLGLWSGKVDVFLVLSDDAGVHAQIEGKRLGLELKPTTLQDLLKNGLSFERNVQLKPTITSLRVLVVDENSGRMGSVTIPAASLPASN